MIEETELKREIRKNKRRRSLKARSPRCQRCVEANPFAMVSARFCYECQIQNQGKSLIERHHFAGQHNDPFTVSMPGNDHRVVTDLQQDWPIKTLRNPNGSPALKAAASTRGFLDLLELVIKRILGWIPEFLETLDEYLVKLLGSDWWKNISGPKTKAE
jgi:hypothetical protein